MDLMKPYKKAEQWGHSQWIYCGKDVFVKELFFIAGRRTSMHSHERRYERLYVSSGSFIILTQSGRQFENKVHEGDMVAISPGTYHQIIALTDGKITEITSDYDENDIVRVESPRSPREKEAFRTSSMF